MGLIVLVVVGHLWAYLPEDGPGNHLYDFLYLWHMPAFIFLSGYLSQGYRWTGRRTWHLFTSLAVPYIIFEAALALFRIHVGGEQLSALWADPHFPLWYLPALLVWRLLAPIFRPMWGGLTLAVGISLVGGFLHSDTAQFFDMSRMMGFLPFFVLGLKATPERLEQLRTHASRVLSLAVFAVLGVLGWTFDEWGQLSYLYARSYDIGGDPAGEAMLIRVVVLAAGMAGALAWLSLVPRIDGWFARMGAATLIVYLFHGFAVKGLEFAGSADWVAGRPWSGLVGMTVAGLAITFFLASPPVRRVLQHVADPFASARKTVDDAVEVTAVVQEHEAELEEQVEQQVEEQTERGEGPLASSR